jgi:hypothetical protein
MARRSRTARDGGLKPRPLLVIHLGDDTFRHVCELADGTVIAPGQIVPYLADTDLETILFDGPTTVISVSHRRGFTGAVRKAIAARDRHCQHPSGCDQPADVCDVDHIIPHSAGGETSQFNGRLQCPTHNRNPDRHDHHATPHPDRAVTRLDELRALIRWRHHHYYPNDFTDDDSDDRDGEAS